MVVKPNKAVSSLANSDVKKTLPVQMGWGLVKKGVVLAYKLPSHNLWAWNNFHDHLDLLKQKITEYNSLCKHLHLITLSFTISC